MVKITLEVKMRLNIQQANKVKEQTFIRTMHNLIPKIYFEVQQTH